MMLYANERFGNADHVEVHCQCGVSIDRDLAPGKTQAAIQIPVYWSSNATFTRLPGGISMFEGTAIRIGRPHSSMRGLLRCRLGIDSIFGPTDATVEENFCR